MTWQYWQCSDTALAILADCEQDKTPHVVRCVNHAVTFWVLCITYICQASLYSGNA